MNNFVKLEGDSLSDDDIIFNAACDDIQNKKYEDAYGKFLSLARKLNAEATYNLGLMCEDGLDNQPHKARIKACKWFILAEKLGHKDAKQKRIPLQESMDDNEKSRVEEAIDKWFA